METTPPFVMERQGRLQEMDRSFDIAYWQRQGPEAIFQAAWEMLVEVEGHRPGTSHALTFQRTVESFQRTPR